MFYRSNNLRWSTPSQCQSVVTQLSDIYVITNKKQKSALTDYVY